MQPDHVDSPPQRTLIEFVLLIRHFYYQTTTIPCKTSKIGQLLVAGSNTLQEVSKVFPPGCSRSSLRAYLGKSGFSIIEVLIVITILGFLLSIASPAYNKHQDRLDTNQAKQDILAIQAAIDRFYIENNHFPESLTDISKEHLRDPWGTHYYYLNVASYDKKSTDAKVRRDKKLKPVNSDFDLYSAGKDGLSKPSFTAAVSRDDIVRCNNGQYLGLAGDY